MPVLIEKEISIFQLVCLTCLAILLLGAPKLQVLHSCCILLGENLWNMGTGIELVMTDIVEASIAKLLAKRTPCHWQMNGCSWS